MNNITGVVWLQYEQKMELMLGSCSLSDVLAVGKNIKASVGPQ